MFCPGELIIVKCSKSETFLYWRIGKTSFTIFRTLPIIFTAYPEDDRYIYMNTSIGLLNFYRNESYLGSTHSHSTIFSELHMHLKDANDFIEVSCEISYQKTNFLKITVFPGMLIMEFDK